MNRHSTFVTNNATATAEPSKAQALQVLSCNSKPSLIRNDRMEGRDYIVVPMVMLTAGVHAGSNGPLYYPEDELAKTPAVWNHKPVVVYHPQLNGQGISACDPEVLSTHKVGVIMNTRYEDGKLKSEAWLEANRIAEVDDRIQQAIDEQAVMELSTGLFTDNYDESGKYNGEAYTAVARNYRPDHLALLPDQVGACSVSKGAGFIRNSLQTAIEESGLDDQLRKYVQNKLEPLVKRVEARWGRFIANELSFDEVRQQLRLAVESKYNVSEDVYVWIEDVFDTYFVYEYQNKLWSLDYTRSEDSVSISGEPVEVRRTIQYKSLTGNLVGNQSTTTKPTMNREEVINNLIKNGSWKESDRDFLNELSDERLQLVGNSLDSEAGVEGDGSDPKAPEPTDNGHDPEAPATAEQFIANAPEGIREVLQESMATHNAQRAAIVQRIVSNKRNTLPQDVLTKMPLAQLRAIDALANPPTKPTANSFAGNGEVIDNSAPDEEPLVAPTMAFEA